ncbi:MFS transporter [Sciscionella marina]|uniref:MFS transporter n=1 Tax=Sciscionella marina TaxID=508770 RepID=UPI000360FE6D|nr:MFS transporter [Sciscionella marina]
MNVDSPADPKRTSVSEHGSPVSRRAVVLASVTGTVIEWYDFMLYATASALVLGPAFFPGGSAVAGTLAAFATYAVGFFFRPVGAVVCGHFGDRIGRKAMLVFTLVLMGVSTVLVGVLPTYSSIGVTAPILLIVLRCLQGFAAGGEWGGAALLNVEHAPPGKRGRYGGLIGAGIAVGILLSSAVFSAVSGGFGEAEFTAWGWRIPFLVSAVLVAFGLVIRMRVSESPAFEQVKQSGQQARIPLLEVLRNNPRQLLLSIGTYIGVHTSIWIVYTFMLTYGSLNGVGESVMLGAVTVASIVELVGDPFFGGLSDKYGRRTVMLGGAIFTILFVFPMFWLVDSGTSVLVYLALAVALIGISAQYGPAAAYFSEQFGARTRYSGASLGYQASATIGGGTAPLIATALFAAAGNRPWAVALYVIVLTTLTIVCVRLSRETGHDELPR